MDRRQFLAVSAAGLTAATAGCLETVLGSDSNDGSAAQGSITGSATGESVGRTIEVSANGEVETEPDEARLRVGIEATGESADEVETDLAERADDLRDAFDELEIPDDDVESGRYTIRPERDGSGYQGAHSFQIRLEDVDRAGAVIDAVTAAGADDVGRVSFGLSDEKRAELRGDALDHALENADEEARHIADNRGVAITGTKSVSTRNVDVVPVRADGYAVAEADDSAAGATPQTQIDTGYVTVSASVEVVYGFEESE
ncbi:SIMPL domain-containing protein [Natrarchaeobius sp. A-rgal3]|uniref:SIMPL domain-containing protein n=1 Tax=Natrarchaeobius versutus TaxID=1679078 RepID=UPI00351059E3